LGNQLIQDLNQRVPEKLKTIIGNILISSLDKSNHARSGAEQSHVTVPLIANIIQLPAFILFSESKGEYVGEWKEDRRCVSKSTDISGPRGNI
jgi:hypothetical protein